MSHSLFDAVRMAGAHDLVDWQPWQDMLDLNLSTWAEDSVSNRSDCHAWGSVPLQHFPRWVLGVSSQVIGFRHRVGTSMRAPEVRDGGEIVGNPDDAVEVDRGLDLALD